MHLNINKDKLKIKLYGSFVADIADLFVGFFKKTIINAIVKEVDNSVPALVSDDLNSAILSTAGIFALIGDLAFDFSLTAPILVTDTQLDMYLNATLFNSTVSEIVPKTYVTDLSINKNTTDFI
jgi:hypothetical protein